MLWTVAFAVTLLSSAAPLARAEVQTYNLTVKSEIRSPDCLERRTLTVNGLFPGPTIRIRSGDTVLAHVTNGMPSECPILPGETFLYNFTVPDQVGTFWYHAHLGMERAAGAWGLFIVDPPLGQSEPFAYDQELDITLADWYHMDEIYYGYYFLAVNGANPPANSFLLNGRGQFNCTPAIERTGGYGDLDPYKACNVSSADCGPTVLKVQPNTTYRARILSGAAQSYMLFSIENHTLTIVQADGGYTEPRNVSVLEIASGQSYSVLFTTNQAPNAYYVSVRSKWETPGYCMQATGTGQCPHLTGTLLYSSSANAVAQNAPPPSSLQSQGISFGDPSVNASIAFQKNITMNKDYVTPLTWPPTRNITILTSLGADPDSHPVFALNGIEGREPVTPLLIAEYYNVSDGIDNTAHDTYRPGDETSLLVETAQGLPVYRINGNESGMSCYGTELASGAPTESCSVLIVFQNSMVTTQQSNMAINDTYLALLPVAVPHAWHLQGHDFWVVGQGRGVYDATESPKTFNLVNPIYRNTVALYPRAWAAIMFNADNPGAWFVHCHLDAHMWADSLFAAMRF
ncbi:hypothetical protein KFL_001310085 [Klebsormidium nitens]|uniref:Laccase n=1 Tax=Klebsormidium nitens TaxID=105231 RepID=A0A1Y1I2K0_KLENI|nr:hypothetical protein KFL_001310085 [Klebsormidium nitens]|eukprot:GAQ82977.1 hypothetical protein KFL_001310085 [Klebsormidium nitens]